MDGQLTLRWQPLIGGELVPEVTLAVIRCGVRGHAQIEQSYPFKLEANPN